MVNLHLDSLQTDIFDMDSSTPTVAPAQVTIYNPNENINLFSDSLSRKGPGIINVRGIYHRGKGGNYSGYYYDALKDEFSP